MSDEQQEAADRFILGMVTYYARQEANDRHLRECPDLVVSRPDAFDGTCGFDTCEMVTFKAELTCPHRPDVHYYQSWESGELADMIEDYKKTLN